MVQLLKKCSINSPALQASLEPRAARIARAATITALESLPSEVIDKTKICLLDLIGCAFEARGLPWSRQTVGLAQGALDGREHDFGIQPVGARPTEIR